MVSAARSRFLLVYAVAFAALPGLEADAISIDLRPNENFCFFENAQTGDSLTITFETSKVHSQGLIDFTVTGVNGGVVAAALNKAEGSHTVQADFAGKYQYCFSNERWADPDKQVVFNVHVVRKADDPNAVTDPLEKEIRKLSQAISHIEDEQEYIMMREAAHRDTAESTNSRVVWWSFFEMVVLVSVCLWQVWYLRRFFEVKRVV